MIIKKIQIIELLNEIMRNFDNGWFVRPEDIPDKIEVHEE